MTGLCGRGTCITYARSLGGSAWGHDLPGKFWIFRLSESVSGAFLRVKVRHLDV